MSHIYTMTPAERDAFLALPHIAVLCVPDPGRGPLAVPVWFYFEPGGDLCVWTSRKARKARLLQGADRITVCVQDPAPPYKYVTVEGPFSIEPAQYERDVRPMALRYFGAEMGERYLASIGGRAGVEGDLLVRLHPERWLSVDYSKLEMPGS